CRTYRTGRLGPGTSRCSCPASSISSRPRSPDVPRRWWTRRWASAAMRRRCWRSTRGSPSSVSTATPTPWPWPGGASPRSPTARTWCTRCTTASARSSPSWGWPPSRGSCSTWGCRRCSSTRPPAGSPTRRTRTWTCGWTRPPASPPRRCSTPTRCRCWPGCCASTARSASPCASPRRWPGGGRPRRSPAARSWSSCSTPRCRRRRGGRAGTRGSAPSRRCASRSTASSTRCAPRCRRRWTCSPPVAGWSCWPTSRWRTGWSSGSSWPGRPPGRRWTCRSSCPGTGRSCGSWCAGRNRPARRRSRAIRERRPCGCERWNGSGGNPWERWERR
ncbi:MAG: 16S rRNA (cytosine(1402)-N(4))-methyltransferase, partial [uncultured Pseudonocardia sp.]